MSQNGPKTTSLMMSLTKKSATTNQKHFFQVQTRRLSKSFEGLNSSLAMGRGAMALVRQPKTAGFRLKSRYNIFVDRLSRCWGKC